MLKRTFSLLLALALTVSLTMGAVTTAYADPEEGTVQTETDPQTLTPDTTQPETTPETGTTEPETGDPGTTEPETGNPGTTEPEIGNPGTTEPETGNPGTTEPETGNPGTTEPETGNPGTTEPETGNPGTTEPETGNPGTTEPETGNPGTTEPETGNPGTTEPETGNPGTTEPETNNPGTTEPETNNPGTTEPEDNQPETSTPVVRQPAVDLRLESLTVACGELHPAFDPDVYEYTVYVTPEQQERSCTVEAEAISWWLADVSVEGPETVQSTDVEKTISVSYGSSSRKYMVRVHVLTVGELLLDGVYYAASAQPDATGLPGSFQAVQLNTADGVLPALQSADAQMLLVQFVSEQPEAQPLWYRYDAAAKKLYPAEVVEYAGAKYIQISDGQSFLYSQQNGTGQYYVYDKTSSEWVYQSAEHQQVLAEPVPQTDFLVVAIVMGLWALAATAAVAVLLRRRKGEEENVYFRPRFAVAEEEETPSKEN